MKTFNIGCFEEQGGYLLVEALNEKEAKKIAKNHLLEFGLVFQPDRPAKDSPIKGLDITHRDVHLV